jgi:hypothetical protein
MDVKAANRAHVVKGKSIKRDDRMYGSLAKRMTGWSGEGTERNDWMDGTQKKRMTGWT